MRGVCRELQEVCVCVCERERERVSECVCVCVCACMFMKWSNYVRGVYRELQEVRV